ncbi:MAG: PAS domain S-box protein [Polyangiales bacterium]
MDDSPSASPAPMDFRVIFDAASNAMIIAEASTQRIVEVNATWTRATGISRLDAIATPALETIRWSSDEHQRACLARLALEGQSCECLVSITRGDEAIAHRIKGRAIDFEGRRCVLWELRDVSDERRAREQSERAALWHRSLLQNSVDGICVFDEHRTVVEVNERFAQMLGYEPHELIGKHPWDWDTRYAEGDLSPLVRSRGTNYFTIETEHRRKDGSVYDAEVSVQLARVGDREVAVTISRDISERKLSEQRLRAALAQRERERSFLQTLVQTIPDLVWLKDSNGVYLACNPTFERFFGHAEAAIVGKRDDDFFSREQAEFFRMHDRNALRAGRPTVNEEWVTNISTGQRTLLRTTKTPMFDGAGALIGVLGIAHDITEQRANELELERHRAQLERIVEERTAELRETHRKMADTQFAMDHAGIGIVWTAPHSERLLYVNDHHAKLLGYTQQGLQQLRLADIDPDFFEPSFDPVRALLREQGRARFETRHRKKNGELIELDMSVYFLRGASEADDRFIAFMTDITDRKERELELVRAKQAAEAASEANAALVQRLEAANAQLAQTDRRLTAMFAISQRASELDEREVLRLAVEEAARLCESEVGYVHCVTDDQRAIELKLFWPETPQSRAALRSEPYPLADAGFWADAARAGRTVLTNDPRSIARDGYPETDVALHRHLGVVVLEAGAARMVMGVANKRADYTTADAAQLQLVANDLWSILLRRRAQAAIVEAKRAAESANAAKSAFLANMSHEIRTPLNAITGMAYLVRRSGVSAEQSERLDKIEQASLHLLEIINAVLDLSKIEARKVTLVEEELDAGLILEDVASLMQEQARAKSLRIVVEDPLEVRRYLGDATRLQQGLLNYVTNAIKFSTRGPITLRAFEVDDDGERALVRFEVEDRGIGVAPESAGRLFAAFEQADNSTTRKYGGTGLGLAITKKLAQLMGGDAGVTSELGVGSVFWFTARLKRSVAEPEAAPIAGGESAEEILARDCSSARLLLVEDEPINRDVTLMLLENIWPVVDVAADGEQAVRMAERRAYDLILMDVQMPNMDGLEATKKIRRLPGRAATPIVALTANAFVEDRQSCLAAGMNDFLSKPVDPAVLFAVILRWLRR